MLDHSLVFDEKDRVGSWVAERVNQLASWGDYYAMGAELNGDLVSGVVYNNVGASNATCHIAVSKPTKAFSTLLDHAFVYAFKQLGLKRLTAFVESTNQKSLKIVDHIGFVEEGVMHQAGDNGQDVIILVLWPGNYRKGRRNG